jgi:hypothetical protein
MNLENKVFPGEQSRRFDPREPHIHTYKPFTVYWKPVEGIRRNEGTLEEWFYEVEPTGHVLFAASIFEGNVYYIKHFEGDAPSRHSFIRDALITMCQDQFLDSNGDYKRKIQNHCQGFLLSDGQFVGRTLGGEMANRYGQFLSPTRYIEGMHLTSEDMW